MKKYLKPVTEIEKGWMSDGPILQGTNGPTSTLDKREGLPIFGGTLHDPSFGASSSFSKYATWKEEPDPEE